VVYLGVEKLGIREDLGKVEVIEYKEKDYYGGSVMYAKYRILKDDLMKTLINLGYEYVPKENRTI